MPEERNDKSLLGLLYNIQYDTVIRHSFEDNPLSIIEDFLETDANKDKIIDLSRKGQDKQLTVLFIESLMESIKAKYMEVPVASW
ncbi:MAG: hypothetical protein QG641_961 [Candidatus Poribacteria bacterium]|nr:hypothetical protein [Candidatus Poribacteria bacterium]